MLNPVQRRHNWVQSEQIVGAIPQLLPSLHPRPRLCHQMLGAPCQLIHYKSGTDSNRLRITSQLRRHNPRPRRPFPLTRNIATLGERWLRAAEFRAIADAQHTLPLKRMANRPAMKS